jgi:hypothetical protein
VVKKNRHQKSSYNDQEEIAKEIVPKTDQEISSDFANQNQADQGINKKQPQQSKE